MENRFPCIFLMYLWRHSYWSMCNDVFMKNDPTSPFWISLGRSSSIHCCKHILTKNNQFNYIKMFWRVEKSYPQYKMFVVKFIDNTLMIIITLYICTRTHGTKNPQPLVFYLTGHASWNRKIRYTKSLGNIFLALNMVLRRMRKISPLYL